MTFSAVLVRLLRLRQGPPPPSRIAPGIRCEVTIALGDNGMLTSIATKLNPGDNPDDVYGLVVGQVLKLASKDGATLEFMTDEIRPLADALARLLAALEVFRASSSPADSIAVGRAVAHARAVLAGSEWQGVPMVRPSTGPIPGQVF